VAEPASGRQPPTPPIDPDQTGSAGPRAATASGGAFGPAPRASRRPRIHWRSVAAVGAGGFLGGLARYGIGRAWPAPADGFPWATFAINTSGTLLLAFLLILVLEVLRPTTYLRPTLGTGFLGAYTTFSSVAVAADEFTVHGRAALAAGYVTASVFAGLAAASFGIILGRSIAASRRE